MAKKERSLNPSNSQSGKPSKSNPLVRPNPWDRAFTALPSILDKSALKATPLDVTFLGYGRGNAVERMKQMCDSWLVCLSNCTGEDATGEDAIEMREVFNEFVTNAFSFVSKCTDAATACGRLNSLPFFSKCIDEATACSMLDSLYPLIDVAPEQIFPQIVRLCTNRQEGESTSLNILARGYLLRSGMFIPRLPKGDISVYRAIELFANELESAAALGMPSQLESDPYLGIFITAASTRALNDSGMVFCDGTCRVPFRFAGTLAYGLLMGVEFSGNDRLHAMENIADKFLDEWKVAIFSRICDIGTVLPLSVIPNEETRKALSVASPQEAQGIIGRLTAEAEAMRKEMLLRARAHLENAGAQFFVQAGNPTIH
jgi:hypothetical protein